MAIRNQQPLLALDSDQLQDLAYRHRERNRSFRNPTAELFKTHTLRITAGSIPTSTLFTAAQRGAPVTMAIEGTPSGGATVTSVIGSAFGGSKLRLGFTGANLLASVGDGGDTINLDTVGALVQDKHHRIVLSVNPASGEARVWVDGKLIKRGSGTVNGNIWADTGAGNVNIAAPSTLTANEMFVGQLPRQFD